MSKKNPAEKSAPTEIPEIDLADDARERAVGFVGVLNGLALAKMAEAVRGDEADFWAGIRTMTATLREDLETMGQCDTVLSNRVFELENRRVARTGGAR